MKKKFIICAIVGILIIGGIILLLNKFRKTKTNEFSLQEYEVYIEQFSSQEMVGAVETAEKAIEIAEEVWLNTYGENVRSKKPYKVCYDVENDVWLVHGSLPIYMSGGVPYILIEKETGRILAVWHEK